MLRQRRRLPRTMVANGACSTPGTLFHGVLERQPVSDSAQEPGDVGIPGPHGIHYFDALRRYQLELRAIPRQAAIFSQRGDRHTRATLHHALQPVAQPRIIFICRSKNKIKMFR